MWVSIYGTGNVVAMHCTGPFLKFLVHDMPTIEKMPHLSLDSLGKEAFLPRPDGGAVDKKMAVGQSCYTITRKCVIFRECS